MTEKLVWLEGMLWMFLTETPRERRQLLRVRQTAPTGLPLRLLGLLRLSVTALPRKAKRKWSRGWMMTSIQKTMTTSIQMMMVVTVMTMVVVGTMVVMTMRSKIRKRTRRTRVRQSRRARAKEREGLVPVRSRSGLGREQGDAVTTTTMTTASRRFQKTSCPRSAGMSSSLALDAAPPSRLNAAQPPRSGSLSENTKTTKTKTSRTRTVKWVGASPPRIPGWAMRRATRKRNWSSNRREAYSGLLE